MKLSQPALSLLEETIKQAIGKYTCGCEQTIVTDIHLQANQSSGEFCIFFVACFGECAFQNLRVNLHARQRRFQFVTRHAEKCVFLRLKIFEFVDIDQRF